MLNNPEFLALLDDKEFVVGMMSQETPEDVQKVFAAKGFALTMDEVNELGRALAEAEAKGIDAELSEGDLDNVAGGFAITVAGLIAAGKIIVAVGGAGLALYKWYKSR